LRVQLAYGRDGLTIDLPDHTEVILPRDPPPLTDEAAAVTASVRGPVASLVESVGRRPRRVVVVFPDLTRPMPNRTVLPPLLAELESAGAGPDEVVLLCATGTHRQASPEEMAELIGPELLARYRVKDHDAVAGDHVEVGSVDGVAILLDRDYVEADIRILTGFVEPHFFAGYSGGPKGACPGLASLSTILEAHSPARIADPRATWTTLEGNPVHDFVRAAVALCPPALSVDVAITRNRRLAAVFAGPLAERGDCAHRQATAFVARHAVRSVATPFDVVVTTNSGYPLDRNLYQAVKGLTAAARVVRPGGTIVMASACADGVPAGSRFAALLAESPDPATMVDPGQLSELDRWQVQVLGRILEHASVAFYTDGIAADDVRAAHLSPVGDVGDAVEAAMDGKPASVCALPDGPLTVPTLTTN
jgi:lactate racemase